MSASPSPATPIRLLVTGASGRMGLRIMALAAESPTQFQLVAALDRPNSPFLGKDAGTLSGTTPNGITLAPTLPPDFNAAAPCVLIDFSAPAATRLHIPDCVARKIPLFIGTTGLAPADQQLIDTAAQQIPILQATNTSLGVNVLMQLVAAAAQQLGSAYDIEIVEAHHNQKKDAPSGTALSLAESICKATGRSLESDLVHGRHGKEALRTPGTIGMHAVRMGDVIGEHTVYFATQGERVEIKHQATNRDTFARGALRAAAWLSQQKPGRYTMANVLGLPTH